MLQILANSRAGISVKNVLVPLEPFEVAWNLRFFRPGRVLLRCPLFEGAPRELAALLLQCG